MADEITADPAFTAYCPECDGVRVLENVAHVVKCQSCGHIVLGSDVL